MPTLVITVDTVQRALEAIGRLREAGLDDDDMSMVARSDIELDALPERFVEEHTDFGPALAKGAAVGGSAGLLAGLVAVAFPPAGIALGGAALLGTTAAGAAVGAWSSALVGSSVPHGRREAYEADVDAGRIVLFADAADDAELLLCEEALRPLAPGVQVRRG